MIPASDIQWLAGLLEGEGSFSVCRKIGRVDLAMTDKDVVERVARLWQRSILTVTPRGIMTRPLYKVVIYGLLAVQWMMTLIPLMGQRRRARIIEVINIWKSIVPRVGENHPLARLTEADVLEIRRSYVNGTKRRVLADRFKISVVTVSHIVRGLTWQHVDGMDAIRGSRRFRRWKLYRETRDAAEHINTRTFVLAFPVDEPDTPQ